MDITENADGSFTATPEDFLECWSCQGEGEDCWYTGAQVRITYHLTGTDLGPYYIDACRGHLDAWLQQLADRVTAGEVRGDLTWRDL